MKEKNRFDYEAALKAIQSGQPILGEKGVLAPLIKNLTEAALEAELDSHLAQEVISNRRNGKGKKTIKSTDGTFDLNTPRDRAGTFEPRIVKKYQTRLSDTIENKIISMYSLGMSYKDISLHIKDMYGLELSNGAINNITEKIIDTVKEWQSRSLESVYPIVWLDAIFYKIREQGQVQSKAVYTVLAVDIEGRKDVLGLYLSESEGANFWLQVLTDLANRGVKDILIACIDGLNGFAEAIESIFPKTQIQLCVVHQIRNSVKYVTHKDKKEFMSDLKKIYKANTKQAAEIAFEKLKNKWVKRYPIVIKSWTKNWEKLTHFFKYPNPIRRVIYTTNTIEAVHRQFRKLTKTKGAFTNENSLLKLLYLGIQNASRKWTMPIPNWALTISQLAIFFENRLDKALRI
jgi:transposase-like protein